MGWLKRLTGGGSSVAERLARLHARGDWAAMLSLAAGSELDSESRMLVDEAGDKLAAINLEQAEACLRAGDLLRAGEHLDLVAVQARSEQLLTRGSELAGALGRGESPEPAAVTAHDCAGCGSAPSAPTIDQEHDELPEDVAWELLLGTLPEPLAERYAGQPPAFRSGVLASRQGEYAAALTLLQQDPADDDLQTFELALLHLRLQDPASGLPLLESLLERHPEHEPALQLAIDLALQGEWRTDLRPLLHQRLEAGLHLGLCHAALARLEMAEGHEELFLKHGWQALECGTADAGLVTGLATLLEQRGDQADAERLLKLLPGSGCHGGAHPLLGEFWLRQGRCLDQALESFKAASRQEPGNRRWPLRIGQAYLRRGWRKDGERLLRRLLDDPELTSDQREEIVQSLGLASGR